MTDLFLNVVSMSISATWLAMAVVVLRLILKKAPKWVNVLLWGMVAVRLICPFTLESGFSLIPEQVSSGKAVSEWTDDYVGNVEIIHDDREEFQEAVSAGRTPLYAGEDGYYVVTAPDGISAPRTVENTVAPLLSVLWCVGMAAMGEYALFSYWRLRRRVRMAIHVTDNIYLSEFIDTPFVLGLLRTRIYLPYHMSERDSHHVIAHERTHIQRKDHWWKPLGFGLLTIHWFNPAMWVAYILLCRDIELACDEKVIKELGMEQRADYSQALLNCSVHHKQIAACPLAFGEVGVKERVKNVLRYQKPAFWVVVICVVVIIVVAVCFLTDPVEQTDRRSVSFQDVVEIPVETVKLINMHNGTISYIATPSDVTSITEFIRGISGHSGISSKGYYEGSYSVTLISPSGEETSIGFGDSDSVYYGDFGDGYPVRYELKSISITEVTEFFAQYDISVMSFTQGVILDVESVSPVGATVVFRMQETTPAVNWQLMGGNDYALQRKVDGVWEELPTLTEPVFTTEAYDITNVRRHNINWAWLYGTLPAGEYRIGKSISVHKGIADAESGTVYAEFTIDGYSNNRNLKLNLGWFTASGIHFEMDISNAGAGEEYYYSGAELYPDQADAPLYTTSAEDASGPQNLLENPELTILWQDAPPSGNYRADIQILHIMPSGEEEVLTYSVHLGISEGSSYMSPLVLTQKLNADGLRGSAEYLNAGGGYNFFDDMTEEIVSILKGLTSEDILPSPGIHPNTAITLRNQDLAVVLRSDGEYVEFSFEGKQAVTIGNGIWAVKNPALNDFFAMINSFSPENSTYEIYNVAPLNELPRHYSMEEASIDKVVITENGLVLANSEVWAEFWDDTQHHIPATVRCMNVSDAGSDIYDIEFDGEEYHYRIMRDGELWDISYRYLKFFHGDAPEHAEYDAFEYFVLVNDANVTWEQIQRSYISSQSADEVDHRIVHRHHIYYPKQPNIPSAVQAELVVGGESLALVTDEKTVHEILHLLNGAQWLGFEPATYFFGPQLMLLAKDGTAYSLDLDVTDDLCRFGDKFYDYGPGMDGDASINNLPRLLALFGLEDWPESVKERFPDLFA